MIYTPYSFDRELPSGARVIVHGGRYALTNEEYLNPIGPGPLGGYSPPAVREPCTCGFHRSPCERHPPVWRGISDAVVREPAESPDTATDEFHARMRWLAWGGIPAEPPDTANHGYVGS